MPEDHVEKFWYIRKRGEAAAEELLLQMGLPVEYLDKYPHELSGGECQRAALARAMAMRPQILVCDEVTSALDVSVQAQIVDLLLKLKEEGEISMIFISHDLALVQGICDKIIVMKDGRIEEAEDIRAGFKSSLQRLYKIID